MIALNNKPVAIDSTVDVVTPENIAFEYEAAGPFRRLPAFLIDFCLRIALVIGVSMALGMAGILVGEIAPAIILLFVFVVEWFYGGLFETFWNGQTPGKWLLGIRVLTVDGQPINGLQAVMRNILRFVDMMPLVPLPFYYVFEVPPIPFVPTFVVGLIAPMCNNRYQRLGDIVCGTMVVIEERKWLFGVAKLDDPRTPHLAAWIPPNYEISRSLAKAVSAYVERRRFFSTARRREIARHLGEPILKRLGLPSDTSHDLLLCALYYRAFIADHGDDRAAMSLGQSPFAAPQPPQYQRRKGPPPMAPTPLNAQNSSAQTDDENHEPPNPGLNIQAEPVSARLRR